MTEAHWIFLVPSGLVIAVAGVLATIKELREDGFLWRTWALRLFFMLVTAGVGFAMPKFAPQLTKSPLHLDPWLSMVGALIIFVLAFSVEVFAGALNISAIVFGAMIGIIVAHLAYFLLLLVIEPMMATTADASVMEQYALTLKLLLSVVFAYMFALLVHKNRDRFNFVIPYIEFRRERRGGSALIVDTSAIVDGRLAELCDTRIIEGPLIIPRFVLRELQQLADSADKLKRERGRHGMDMLNRLRKNPNIIVHIDESRIPGAPDVDTKLIKLAETLDDRILTNDVNLTKVATVQGVRVINLNEVAAALKPTLLPGEHVVVELLRPGEAQGQAVGFLNDGTMVVVENARRLIGTEVEAAVTRTLQTATGRIIFARLPSADAAEGQAVKQGQP